MTPTPAPRRRSRRYQATPDATPPHTAHRPPRASAGAGAGARAGTLIGLTALVLGCAGGGVSEGNNPTNNTTSNSGGPCPGTSCTIDDVTCAGLTQVVRCVDDGGGCGTYELQENCTGGASCSLGQCQAGCNNDGDQHGESCNLGLDCDDSDADRFHGADESCDGKDNDCDGQTDEGNVCQADCSSQECVPGTRECVDDQQIRECRPGPDRCGRWTSPVSCGAEGCSDDSCSGCDDNDGDQRGEGCALGTDCDDDDPNRYEGADEACDGIDNDCDDDIDEDFADLGTSCTAGIGACQVTGSIVCDASGGFTNCDATAGTPADEICGDGIDNDCDEETDEGFDNVGTTCTDTQGACVAEGVFVCDGASTRCTADVSAADETCDGRDNDCDGEVDEGCSGCVEDDLEPNNSSGAATSLPRGTSRSARACGSGSGVDRDWFALGSYNSGETMTIDLDFDTPGAEMHMEVYTSVFETRSDISAASHTLTWTTTSSGTFYLWVYPNTNPVTGTSYTVTHH